MKIGKCHYKIIDFILSNYMFTGSEESRKAFIFNYTFDTIGEFMYRKYSKGMTSGTANREFRRIRELYRTETGKDGVTVNRKENKWIFTLDFLRWLTVQRMKYTYKTKEGK